MAPEVATSKPYGRPVDVYSFAMILYNLYASEPPWRASPARAPLGPAFGRAAEFAAELGPEGRGSDPQLGRTSRPRGRPFRYSGFARRAASAGLVEPDTLLSTVGKQWLRRLLGTISVPYTLGDRTSYPILLSVTLMPKYGS